MQVFIEGDHWKNASDLINDKSKSNKIKSALEENKPQKYFKGKELAILNYAEKLTKNPDKIKKSDFNKA